MGDHLKNRTQPKSTSLSQYIFDFLLFRLRGVTFRIQRCPGLTTVAADEVLSIGSFDLDIATRDGNFLDIAGSSIAQVKLLPIDAAIPGMDKGGVGASGPYFMSLGLNDI